MNQPIAQKRHLVGMIERGRWGKKGSKGSSSMNQPKAQNRPLGEAVGRGGGAEGRGKFRFSDNKRNHESWHKIGDWVG